MNLYLLTHICICRRRPLGGIQPQPYHQLSVINRNTGRTNPPVTTNKHLWGRLKAVPGFLSHTRARAHTLTPLRRCRSPGGRAHASSRPFICSEGYSPRPANYFDLQKQTPSLPLDSADKQIGLSFRRRQKQLSPHKGL